MWSRRCPRRAMPAQIIVVVAIVSSSLMQFRPPRRVTYGVTALGAAARSVRGTEQRAAAPRWLRARRASTKTPPVSYRLPLGGAAGATCYSRRASAGEREREMKMESGRCFEASRIGWPEAAQRTRNRSPVICRPDWEAREKVSSLLKFFAFPTE